MGSTVGPHLLVVFWIRIRIDFGRLVPDLDPGLKIILQNYKKEKKFHVLKCWIFSFEGLRLL
jgi:hypothetical protein